MAQFKHGDFSTCDVPCPGQPKTVNTPEIIVQVHELILEGRQIYAKSIAEHLTWAGCFQHSWRFGHAEAFCEAGPKMLEGYQKIQRCLTSFWNFLGSIPMISCRGRFVTIEETWFYHYDLEAKPQSMECRHSGTPRPKIIHVRNPLQNSHLDFFGSKHHFPHWLPSKGPNYQRAVLLISAGAIERHFDG